MKPAQSHVDARYSADGILPTPWNTVFDALVHTEIYALTTILPDGMPHTVPVTGIFDQDRFLFCTGSNEQKVRNIDHDARGSVHIGSPLFFEGIDVVVRGRFERVREQSSLHAVAEAFVTKYGDFWSFDIGDDALINHHGLPAWVYRLVPQVAYSFTRGDESAQTRYDFAP